MHVYGKRGYQGLDEAKLPTGEHPEDVGEVLREKDLVTVAVAVGFIFELFIIIGICSFWAVVRFIIMSINHGDHPKEDK